MAPSYDRVHQLADQDTTASNVRRLPSPSPLDQIWHRPPHTKPPHRGRGLRLAGHRREDDLYDLVKGRRPNQISFAYDVVDAGPVKSAGDEPVNELRALKLYEVSLVPVGANQDTSVVAVKSVPRSAATQTLALRLAILTANT
ncbi:HK97 family phage prohead protease [Diaminobutyricibacter sp. McL0618]|uniref:HK97 family phage prohead protease n=1 Tax=Leifsonia sp. McL0618 TaxID=3415677 RepID=UPI003CEB058E